MTCDALNRGLQLQEYLFFVVTDKDSNEINLIKAGWKVYHLQCRTKNSLKTAEHS